MKIAAVVVTYNRLELLKKCVSALRNQTRKLDEIIVVNNSSTDGTYEWLNEQTDLTIITQDNSGSAGGQYTGIKKAFLNNSAWIWCLDTDIIVNKNALEVLLKHTLLDDVGFLSSLVLDKENEVSFINLPYLSNSPDKIISNIYKLNLLPILSSSFGSLLVNSDAVEVVGYPAKNFFIWGDDVEYTFRMIKAGFNGYLVPDSIVTHVQPENLKNPFITMKLGDLKSKFAIRNTVFTIIEKNKLLNRGILYRYASVINFLVITISERIKLSGRISFRDLFKILHYTILGIIFKPDIN